MKAPAMWFYVKDWKADTDGLSVAAKGAWIQIICTLHLAKKQGSAIKTLAGWARVFGTNEAEAEALLKEIKKEDCAHVTFRPTGITVASRRMVAARKNREAAALRKRRQRSSQAGHKNVTPYIAVCSMQYAKQVRDISPNLDTATFLETWAKWIAYRTETRHKLTETTREMQLKKLAKVGPAVAIAMIEQSIEQGWRGLFPPKGNAIEQRQPIEAGDKF